jgi:biopolymer transport protein ExbD
VRRFDQINVIPFIDIMLVLLAIVLTTATFVAQGVIPVDLPEAREGEPVAARERLEIAVDREGRWFVGEERVDEAGLERLLADRPADQPVLLRVDGDARFQAFVGVIDRLKARGMDDLAILTERGP